MEPWSLSFLNNPATEHKSITVLYFILMHFFISFVFPSRLFMVTWNVATAEPPDDLTSLLHLNSPNKPDLYVIGLVLIGISYSLSNVLTLKTYITFIFQI